MNNLSPHWFQVQHELLPFLEEKVGTITQKHERLVAVIEFADMGKSLNWYYGRLGRPREHRLSLAHAFLAKVVYNFPTTRALIDRLHCDPVLRRICGWERKSHIPSESKFSRAFKEFADAGVVELAHNAFIKKFHADRIIGHVSRDATAIEGHEKVAYCPKEPVKKTPKKNGRPKKGEERPAKEPTRIELQKAGMTLQDMLADLPTKCDVGTKVNSKGYKTSWKGYKYHIDTIDGDIPVSALLTSASMHDSQAAIPLILTTAQKITPLYELMDAAYDAQPIRAVITNQGSVALIDFNHRGPNDTRCFAPHEAVRYKERSAAERVNSNLKDNYGGRFVRVKGNTKVSCHLGFGLLAIAIEQTLRLLN